MDNPYIFRGINAATYLCVTNCMRQTLFFIIILLISCTGSKNSYVKAENALDAGREFINACAVGDFSKAAFFMVPAEKNTAKLKENERLFREKDKEGRQQLRNSSIVIGEVKELNDSATLIYYSNSFDKQPQVLEVVKQNGNWLVNFDNAYKSLQ